MKISAAIIAFNEERNIARAIESLRFADQIVVVDSGSTDATREIAAKAGARVIEEQWRGYAAQKNFAATVAAHDWILSLDADEAVTPELAAEFARVRASTHIRFRVSPNTSAAGFATAAGIPIAKCGSIIGRGRSGSGSMSMR